jgi:hypothetical protein
VRAAGLLALALAVSACDAPPPPAVEQREPSLEADDLAVIRAVLDELRRDRREAMPVQHVPPPRFLVVDTTMAMCRRDPEPLGPQPGRCLDPGQLTPVLEVVPAELRRTVALNFPIWTAKRLPIAGPLGDDVTLVSATLVDTLGPGELIRQHPGSAILWLSAIGYPAPGMAVIRLSGTGSFGAARVERLSNGGWHVAATAGRAAD